MTNPPSILVTGANRGLGLEFVRQYAADNWRVFACCRNPARASELASLSDSHPSISVHRLDVAHHEQIDELAEKLRDESIDILMNNAGIDGPGPMSFGRTEYQARRAEEEGSLCRSGAEKRAQDHRKCVE